jgi:hypothetical protein
MFALGREQTIRRESEITRPGGPLTARSGHSDLESPRSTVSIPPFIIIMIAKPIVCQAAKWVTTIVIPAVIGIYVVTIAFGLTAVLEWQLRNVVKKKSVTS